MNEREPQRPESRKATSASGARRLEGAVAGTVGAGALAAMLLMGSAPAAAQPCIGDCGGDGLVTVDEIVTLVNLALTGGTAGCGAGDGNLDGSITVDEVITAVNFALTGCPGADALQISGDCSRVGATGRVACAAGSQVRAFLCRGTACARTSPPPLSDADRLAPLPGENDRVGSDGTFDFAVELPDTSGDVVGPILLEADALRRIDYGGAGGQARGTGSAARFALLGGAIDPSSDSTVALLDGTGQVFAGEEMTTAVFDRARVATETLPTTIAGAERVEAEILYDGQVEGDREVRRIVGLPTNDYHRATLTLPGGCGDPDAPAQLDARAGVPLQLPISRSAEIRVNGNEPSQVQALYLTNILNGPGGNPFAIRCPDSSRVICEFSVAPGASFRSFRNVIEFPVPGVAEMLIVQQVRVTPIDVVSNPNNFIEADCNSPDCSYTECFYTVTVR